MQAAGKPLKVLVVDELFSEHHPRANGSMACIEVLPGAIAVRVLLVVGGGVLSLTSLPG